MNFVKNSYCKQSDQRHGFGLADKHAGLYSRTIPTILALTPLLGASQSPSAAQSTNPAVDGQWSKESPWPTVGIHLDILTDVRVLTSGQDLLPSAGGVFPTYVVT